MKITRNSILSIVCFLLVLMWCYAAFSKLENFGLFKGQMDRQLLFPWLRSLLVYLLPPFEIVIALALLFDKTRFAALYTSALLLISFSIYIALGLSKMLGKIPCSCGGILGKMHWGPHLVFNVFFLLLTATGIFIVSRERRQDRQT